MPLAVTGFSVAARLSLGSRSNIFHALRLAENVTSSVSSLIGVFFLKLSTT